MLRRRFSRVKLRGKIPHSFVECREWEKGCCCTCSMPHTKGGGLQSRSMKLCQEMVRKTSEYHQPINLFPLLESIKSTIDQVGGFDGVPAAGEVFTVVGREDTARDLAEARRKIARESSAAILQVGSPLSQTQRPRGCLLCRSLSLRA